MADKGLPDLPSLFLSVQLYSLSIFFTESHFLHSTYQLQEVLG